MEGVNTDYEVIQKVFDQFSKGIVVFNDDLKISYCNQEFLEKSGVDQNDIQKLPLSEFLRHSYKANGTLLKQIKAGEVFQNDFQLAIGDLNGLYLVEIHPIIEQSDFQGGYLSIDLNHKGQEFDNIPNYHALVQAFQNTKEAIMITEARLDQPGPKISYVNPAFTWMTGYEENEVIGNTPRMFQGPKTDRKVIEDLRQKLEANDTFSGETVNYRKDGSEFILQWEITPLKNEDGAITHYLALQRDVTAQRKAEQNWEESEHRFKRLVENAPIAMFIHQHGDFIFSNHKAAKLFGYEQPKELLGHNLFEFIREDFQEIGRQRMARLEQGEDIEPLEEVFVQKDGTEIDVEIEGIPCFYRGEQAIQTIVTDITKRKRAERDLLENEELFRMISENSRDFIALHNLDATFSYASPSVKEIIGVEPKDIIGQSPYPLMHPDDKDYLAEIHQHLLEGVETRKAKYRVQRMDGKYIWIEAFLFPVKDENGTVVQFQTVSRDVTEEQNLRELLEETQEIAVIGGWSYSFDDDEFFFSKKVMDIYGMDYNEEVTKERAIYYYDPEHQPIIRQAFDELASLGKPFDLELKLWHNHEEMLWVRAIGKPFYDKSHLYKVGGSLQDITEQKQVRDRLKESEETFRSFAEHSLVGVYMYQDGKMRYANPKVTEITGYELDEIEDMSPFEIAHPEDKRLMQEKIEAREASNSQGEHYEFRFYTKQGELRHAELFGSKITYKDRPAIIGTMLDITERKQAEDQLIEKQHFIEKITESSPNVISVIDYEKMQYVYNNTKIKNFIGYTLEEINQFDNIIGELMHPDDSGKMEEAYLANQKLEDGEVNQIEFRLMTKEGKYKWLLSLDTPFKKDDEGNVIQVLSTVQDIDERKKAEEKLMDYQHFMEKVLINSPNLIHVFDYQTNQFVFVSQSLEENLGYSSEEINELENGISELFHPEDMEKIQEAHHKNLQLKDGEVNEVEFRIQAKGGEWRWVLVRDTPFKRDENGQLAQVLSTVQNVTEQKNAEQEIIEKQKFIESVAANSPSIIHIHDYNEQQIIYSNRRVIDNLGYNEAEIKEIEKNPRSICHPDDIESIEQHHRENVQLADKEVNTLEYRVQHKHGHWVWLLNKDIVFKRDERGNVQQVLGMVEDTTDQKQLFESVKRNEALFRQLFQNAPVGIVRVDNHYQVQSCNEGFTEIFKYSREEVEGAYLNEVIVPENYKGEATQITNRSLMGTPHYEESVRMDKYGNLIPVFIYGVPVFLDGKAISIFGIYVDISEQKRAEEDLKRQTDELLRSNAELEQFAYVTSHNLRAPVVNIKSLVEFFDPSELQDENNQYVFNKIDQSTQQLNETLNDLINIVARKKELSQPKEKIDLQKLFDKILDVFESQIEECGANVKADFSNASEIYYLKGFLESILHNLLSNALKYSSPDRKPEISFKTKRQNGYVCLTVRDNGLGIDLEQHKDKIFNLYKRFHFDKSGKGMGLYLVKSQVESLGGKVEIESTINEGTTFYLYLKDFYKEAIGETQDSWSTTV